MASYDGVEVPRRIYEECLLRMYAHVDGNLDEILAGMRAAPDARSNQLSDLLASVMAQTAAVVADDATVAGASGRGGNRASRRFASFFFFCVI